MDKTVREYFKNSSEVLNSMLPFSKMESYANIDVIYKVKDLRAEIKTSPWKALIGFPFYERTLDELKFQDVSIGDMKFVSIEIINNGLVITCKTK